MDSRGVSSWENARFRGVNIFDEYSLLCKTSNSEVYRESGSSAEQRARMASLCSFKKSRRS
jgi:hypothetical protein